MNAWLALLVVAALAVHAVRAIRPPRVAHILRAIRSITPKHVGFAALVVVLWASHVEFPDPAYLEPTLDNSWRQGLGYALVHGMRFGVDIVFNHGPLGWFHESPPMSELLVWKVVAFEGCLKLALSVIVLLPLFWIRGRVLQLVFFLAALLPDSGLDGFAAEAILVAAFVLMRGVHRASPWIGVVLFAVACLALVKFTYFVLAAACLLLAVIAVAGMRTLRAAVAILFGYGVALVLVWCIAGQRPLDLPAYVVRSIPVASDFTEAMACGGKDAAVAHALGICGVAGLLVVFRLFQFRRRPRPFENVVGVTLVATVLYFMFKAGLVRHDGAVFFSTACFAPFLLTVAPTATDVSGVSGNTGDSPSRSARRFAACLAIACSGLGLYGMGLSATAGFVVFVGLPIDALKRVGDNLGGFLRVDAMREEGEEQRERLAAMHALTRVRRTIQDAPVDSFDNVQANALLTGLEWTPRPVFQAYAAYGPRLLERNRAFYAAERAPPFVLLCPSSVDRRYPFGDDTLALQEILRRYDAISFERDYVLLQRSNSPRTDSRRALVVDGEFRFGESIELPAGGAPCHVVRIDVRTTGVGSLKRALFRIEQPRLEWTGSDGIAITYDFVPALARAGMLIDPLPIQLRRFFAGLETTRLRTLRVLPPEHETFAYRDSFHLSLESAPDLAPSRPISPSFVFALFDPLPVSSDAGAKTPFRLGSHDALSVGGISRIEFRLEPGRHHARGTFGMLAPAAETAVSDGMQFRIAFAHSDRIVFERSLDPVREAADREAQAFELEFDVGDDRTLIFQTLPGPAGNTNYDHGWWGELSIAPLETSPAPGK